MVWILGGSTAYKVVARQSPPMAGSPQIVLSKQPSVDSTALKGEQNRKMSLDKKSPIQGRGPLRSNGRVRGVPVSPSQPARSFAVPFKSCTNRPGAPHPPNADALGPSLSPL